MCRESYLLQVCFANLLRPQSYSLNCLDTLRNITAVKIKLMKRARSPIAIMAPTTNGPVENIIPMRKAMLIIMCNIPTGFANWTFCFIWMRDIPNSKSRIEKRTTKIVPCNALEVNTKLVRSSFTISRSISIHPAIIMSLLLNFFPRLIKPWNRKIAISIPTIKLIIM